MVKEKALQIVDVNPVVHHHRQSIHADLNGLSMSLEDFNRSFRRYEIWIDPQTNIGTCPECGEMFRYRPPFDEVYAQIRQYIEDPVIAGALAMEFSRTP